MSRRNGSGPKLDLKLNLSPPRVERRRMESSPTRSASVSPPSSCVSSENGPNSPEATSMLLVGCPRCLMYVMLSENDPKCPKCESTVLLDFLNNNKKN
ncbi:protein GL2-INTERACTING REPRESSOR 1-like [Vicia villosa]|uniref:protein GL2-INTERACTING REPRESSOR 1-like n=1 Tax=Vicia villosa TaxID=3911 RepID=UPI00273B9A41|nr:protein GL2-INTERACTING REPRESSOR 1-like [Vicia villosa]